MTDPANPFRVWAELTRGLRDRFMKELGPEVLEPHAGEMMGSLAALVTRCEHMSEALDRLERRSPAAYEAFLRALAGS